MKLIVGLGNPGKKYKKTRHNIGFMCLDRFEGSFELDESLSAYVFISKDYVLLKPITYMNSSGKAVSKAIEKFNVSDPSDILVVYDDMSLPFGKIRIKQKGGAGGHNGIKSIISELKSSEFNRIKIGISNEHQGDLIDFVLGKFTSEEKQKLIDILHTAYQATVEYSSGVSILDLMNKYN